MRQKYDIECIYWCEILYKCPLDEESTFRVLEDLARTCHRNDDRPKLLEYGKKYLKMRMTYKPNRDGEGPAAWSGGRCFFLIVKNFDGKNLSTSRKPIH